MIKPYNRRSAVAYAHKWALGANPDFYHFGGIGGDCTNFISQCLLAGGGEMIEKPNGWFYVSKDYRSPSWTSVEALQNFLLDQNEGLVASISDISSLEEGDIVQLRQNKDRFNHTLIITKKVESEIYVCAHSNDALDKNLNEYYYIERIGLHIECIKSK